MVDLRDIIKRWGSVTAVDGVSLVVPPGEFLTLLGPSGCGKTTLLRMIGGFEIPTSGTVSLDGQDVTELPPYRRNVNQVFQSYALFPHLDVFDNIAFGLRLKKVPRPSIRERVDRVLELTSLLGFERRMPSQLSGGQRQRVALARAIVNEPKVLLLDEPLGALDARLRHSMQLELKRLQRRLGITFIFVTHDQEEAMTMSDRIAVMSEGKIAQIGAPADIYHRPATAFVAQFIGQTNLLRGRVCGRVDETVTIEISGSGRFDLSVGRAMQIGEEILLSLRPENLHVAVELPPDPRCCTIPAVVVDFVFKGATRQLILRTAAGSDFVAQVPGTTGEDYAAFPAGRSVFCSFDPVHVRPLFQ